MQRIMGLDVSITSTGYCVVDFNKDIVDCGVILTSPKEFKSDLERFDKISDEIFQKAGEHLCRGVFLENYAYAARGNLMRIGELTGIIKHSLFSCFDFIPGKGLFVVAPSTLKKYVTGKGTGDKNLILKHLFVKWSIDIDEDNMADAYVLARIGVDFLNYIEDQSYMCKYKYEEECIKAIAKQNGIKILRRKENAKVSG